MWCDSTGGQRNAPTRRDVNSYHSENAIIVKSSFWVGLIPLSLSYHGFVSLSQSVKTFENSAIVFHIGDAGDQANVANNAPMYGQTETIAFLVSR